MKKVLILSLGRKGGSVRYAKEIIDNLNFNKDVFVSRFCLEGLPNHSRRIITYQNPLQFVAYTLLFLPLFIVKITYRVIKGYYDILYLPYFQYWSILPIILFNLFKKKVVVTIHDGVLHTGDGYPFEQYLNRIYIKKANALIFLTNHVKDLVERNIPFKGTSSVIPHGIIKPAGIKHMEREMSDQPVLLFLGRINKYKGIDLLVEAVSKIPARLYDRLIIAGKSSYNLQNLAAYPKIELIDKWLTEEEISGLINESDLLILPYLEATQSGVVMMGIAGAIPMICTRVGGLVEQLLEDEEALFVEPDPDSLFDGIVRILTNKNLYKRISSNLYIKEKTLSWKNISNKISLVLSQ